MLFYLLCISAILLLLAIFAYIYPFPNNNNDDNFMVRQSSVYSNQSPKSMTFIEKMKANNKNVLVLYGTQTGTAEDFATRLAKTAQSYNMKGLAMDPEDIDFEDLIKLNEIEHSLLILCMATYGEGDPTDNAIEFCEWLRQGETQLDGLKYTVFGLGNKTYEHYNSTGKFIDSQMEVLGAKRVHDLGLGDDDKNIEEDYVTWQHDMWISVCTEFGISTEEQDIRMRQYYPIYPTDLPTDKIFSGEVAKLHSYEIQKPPFDAKNPFLSTIKVHKELHNLTLSDRSCMHLELDISGSKIRYDAGDHVAVFPRNACERVNRLGKLLNEEDLDVVFSLINLDEDSNRKHPFPCPTTFRTALTHYLDIQALPKTNVLRELADFAGDVEQSLFLKEMSLATVEGKKLYAKWIVLDNRSIIDVLEDLPSVKVNAAILCELLPRLQPRMYSISSSSKVYPDAIHITAILVDYMTPLHRHKTGIATSFMKSLEQPTGDQQENITMPIYVRRSQFRLPFRHITPVIMVGPGTGLAPFRGFIQERLKAKLDGKEVGRTVLFFGCRNKDVDYIYRKELEDALDKGGLSHLFLAFSRDKPYEKVYVQHLMEMEETSQLIWDCIESGAHFYICGEAKTMAHDVINTLENIIMSYGKMKSLEEAKKYIKKMSNKGRYLTDVWS